MFDIGFVVKKLGVKWRRKRWIEGEHMYFSIERHMFLIVYRNGKERKWNPSTEDLISSDWERHATR
jgi:hypothetical protein